MNLADKFIGYKERGNCAQRVTEVQFDIESYINRLAILVKLGKDH